MTARQLRTRVEFWQRTLIELGVGHWRIEECEIVEETQHGPRASASVGTSNDYNSVWFQFRKDFLYNAEASRVDETIVHEWLHVAFRDLEDAKDEAETWFPPATWVDFEGRYEHETEGVVEAFARLIVRLHG